MLTYGESSRADVRILDIAEATDGVAFIVEGGPLPRTRGAGRQPGRTAHGPQRRRRADAGGRLGLSIDTVVEAWADFGGVHRRFERHGEAAGVRVYDDYAHHPTEIAAQLRSRRAAAVGAGRLIAVFQPGTYSRTQTFADEFAQAMALADIAVVMDIFPAREEPIPGVTGATIADRIPLPAEQVIYEPSFVGGARRGSPRVAEPGDLVLTMGIGNVYLLCAEILAPIADRAAGIVTDAARPSGRRRTHASLAARVRCRTVVVVRRSCWPRSSGWSVSRPLLGVRTVTVRGTHVLTVAQVAAAAAITHGTPLVRLDTGAVRAPRREAAGRRHGAGDGDIPVVGDRSPSPSGSRSATSRPTARYRLVDRSGVAFRTTATGAGRSAALPAVDRRDAVDQRRGGRAVAASLPSGVLAEVDVVNATEPTAIQLALRDGRTIVWGSADRNADKARLLPVLLGQRGRTFDVSNPDVVVVR